MFGPWKQRPPEKYGAITEQLKACGEEEGLSASVTVEHRARGDSEFDCSQELLANNDNCLILERLPFEAGGAHRPEILKSSLAHLS